MYNSDMFHEKELGVRLNRAVRRSPEAVRLISDCNRMVTYAMLLIYPAVLLIMLLEKNSHFLRALLIPAASLAFLTAFRPAVGRKRPFEVLDIEPLLPKEKGICSMPSRHVFSAAVISMAAAQVSPLLGGIGWIMTLVLGVCRVAAGVHYISDVAAGIAAGFLLGLLI